MVRLPARPPSGWTLFDWALPDWALPDWALPDWALPGWARDRIAAYSTRSGPAPRASR